MNVVVIMKIQPQNSRKLDRVTSPVSCGSVRKYLLQKYGDSRARNITYPKKNPAVWPTVLHVEACPTLHLKINS